MRASEARKASYFLASFFTSFLFLLSLREDTRQNWKRGARTEDTTHFFKSSTDMYSRSIDLARSMSAASARMQMDMRGRGTLGNLNKIIRNMQKAKQRLCKRTSLFQRNAYPSEGRSS